MKKRTIAITLALVMTMSAAAACQKEPDTDASVSIITSESSESSADTTPSEETTEATSASSHQIVVEDSTIATLTDTTGEFTSVIPKLSIDGQEATDINYNMKTYIEEKYTMQVDANSGFVTGYQVSYYWGVKDNIISIVIKASYIGEDGATYEAFNYDADRVWPMEASSVVAQLGMTDDEFFGKTADAYRNYWNTQPWLGAEYNDLLEQSISAIGYGEVTPFIAPNGDIAVAGTIYTPTQTYQSVKCFDLDTNELVSFN
ncbi:MAG: hypothetical protein J6Z43_08920 [Clostridiales bacterium]|nr:hypothetical protein [Clostridiales bacterium]